MISLIDYILQAESRGQAVAHFNIANLEMLKAIFTVARRRSLPVVIGLSEGERKFIGDHQAVALVRSLRTEYNYPIFINADHTRTIAGVKEAALAGFDAAIFDGSEESLDDNIASTKQCVEAAKAINPDILIEGELGYIGRSSALLADIPAGAAVTSEMMANPAAARQFVRATGVDLLAPAVGNIHGMLAKGKNPNLDIGRIKEIRQAAGVPLVLHGGSGISQSDMAAGIAAGMPLVHVSTELRLAYRDGLKQALADQPDELAPYRLLAPVIEAISQVVDRSFDIFTGNQT